MHKLGTAVGCLLMIGALAAPVAFAHYDTGNHPLPYVTTGLDVFSPGGANDDTCSEQIEVPGLAGSYIGPIPPPRDDACAWPNADGGSDNANRVSGWYYGSTNLYIETRGLSEQNPHEGPLSQCGSLPEETPVGLPDEEPLIIFTLRAFCNALTGPLDPNFLFAEWGGLGDMEVSGLGNCGADLIEPITGENLGPDETSDQTNERTVDGSDDETSEGGTDVGRLATATPEDTFNDGGHGYVTHTDHYACAAYNTPGCDDYNVAKAEDLVSGEDIWIGAQCNWGVPTSTDAPGLVEILNEFLGRVTNCPLGGFPASCVEAVQYLNDCLGNPLTPPLPATNACGGADSTIVCGNGSVSTIAFGTGDGLDGAGTTFPDAGHEDDDASKPSCNNAATGSVFPFTAVVVTFEDNTPALREGVVSVATYGWVG